MAEYIEREALLKELATHFNKTLDGRTLYHPSMALAMRDVRNAPAVDAEPVKHSRWIEDGGWLICLNCESEINVRNSLGCENRKNYCPNCGAKMDLEDGA